MRAILILLSLGACATMDQHRLACATLLDRPVVADDKPGGPVTAPEGAKPDPAVEACAIQRADAQRREAALITTAILLGAAAGALSTTSRPSYRPSYRSSYRRR